MLKTHNEFSQVSFLDFFHNHNKNNLYGLRSQPDFPRISTTFKGIEFVRHIRSVIWNNLPIEIKNINSFDTFKTEIKKWKPTNCSCRLCKTFR